MLEPVKLMYPDRAAAARFIGFTVMDQAGKHTGLFKQGDWLTVVYDIEVRAEIENFSCGIVYRDDRGFFLHSKHLFQDDVRKLRHAIAGERLRATVSSRLDLNAGSYTLGLDLISIPDLAFKDGKLTFADFDLHHQRICCTPGIFTFTVSFNPDRQGAEFSPRTIRSCKSNDPRTSQKLTRTELVQLFLARRSCNQTGTYIRPPLWPGVYLA